MTDWRRWQDTGGFKQVSAGLSRFLYHDGVEEDEDG